MAQPVMIWHTSLPHTIKKRKKAVRNTQPDQDGQALHSRWWRSWETSGTELQCPVRKNCLKTNETNLIVGRKSLTWSLATTMWMWLAKSYTWRCFCIEDSSFSEVWCAKRGQTGEDSDSHDWWGDHCHLWPWLLHAHLYWALIVARVWCQLGELDQLRDLGEGCDLSRLHHLVNDSSASQDRWPWTMSGNFLVWRDFQIWRWKPSLLKDVGIKACRCLNWGGLLSVSLEAGWAPVTLTWRALGRMWFIFLMNTLGRWCSGGLTHTSVVHKERHLAVAHGCHW